MATFTVDLFTTLDGFGSGPVAYWGKQGPELLAQRARTFGDKEQTLVFGANTYRLMLRFAPAEEDAPLNAARKIVISRTLEGPPTWANTTLIAADALDAVPRLKAESPVPLRCHGSIAMNRAPRRRPRGSAGGDGVPRDHRSVGSEPDPRRPARYRPGTRRRTAVRRARAATRLRPDRALSDTTARRSQSAGPVRVDINMTCRRTPHAGDTLPSGP